MPGPGEHKTVQARILKYSQEIGRRRDASILIAPPEMRRRVVHRSTVAGRMYSSMTAQIRFNDLGPQNWSPPSLRRVICFVKS